METMSKSNNIQHNTDSTKDTLNTSNVISPIKEEKIYYSENILA